MINSKQDLLAKGFSLPTLIYRRSSIPRDVLYRIRRFVSEFYSSRKPDIYEFSRVNDVW